MINNLVKTVPFKFLVVGSINTIFAYFFGILSYFLFYETFGIIFVGILNNIIGISFSFILFKVFVFKTRNTNWLHEYMRSYVVYGVKGLFGIFILWLTIEVFKWNIYISHGLSMISTVLITYKGHKSYTFKHNEDGKN